MGDIVIGFLVLVFIIFTVTLIITQMLPPTHIIRPIPDSLKPSPLQRKYDFLEFEYTEKELDELDEFMVERGYGDRCRKKGTYPPPPPKSRKLHHPG
jgi:hypothetical protein